MEQLINAETIPYWATTILYFLGGAFIGVAILIFVIENENIKEEVKVIIALLVIGAILLALGVHWKNIYSRYNNQAKSIVKDVIAKEYPDATEFRFELDTGYFTENDIEYKIQYKKTINNEEKLIISVKKQSNDTDGKQVTTLDIPKETKNNESTND
ncbi:hypothetical protein [Agathobacter rectalis]|uniref:hypothetical protein n=1 Tax=Agathobacter rectalis TaxID=39491 RepID=UPI0027D27788|nr:hypothetical protein [Agathobacter rectalis]MCB7108894.1 DUF2157 domain-containing protein [Agathobacter rectalis]MCG4812186.1 DUF2157 domain-containing protein [Agathobacter rectalis]